MDKNNDGELTNVEETMIEGGQAMNIMNLDSMIKRLLADIDKLKTELKDQRDMFEDAFNNDSVFKEQAEKAKEAVKVKTAAKQQIMKQASVAQSFAKIKEMKSELKELQENLSDYLQQYQKLTGQTQIEGDNGEIMEIVHTFKLIKKSPKFNP